MQRLALDQAEFAVDIIRFPRRPQHQRRVFRSQFEYPHFPLDEKPRSS